MQKMINESPGDLVPDLVALRSASFIRTRASVELARRAFHPLLEYDI